MKSYKFRSPRFLSFLGIFLMGLTIIACNARRHNKTAEVNGAQYIVPSAAEGITLTEGAQLERISLAPEELAELKVELPASHRPIRVLDVSLDNDELEEQIIAYKVREEGSDEIRILAASFDPMYNTLISSWEGVTQATELRSFSIFAEDLVGDHIKELICSGINSRGEQTLDLLRVSTHLGKRGIQFYSVLSLASKSGIEIIRHKRSAAYKNRQEMGASFSVVRYDQYVDENDRASLRTHSYNWNPQTERFIPGAVEEIPYLLRERQHYTQLFHADIEELTDHLSGIWQDVDKTDRLFYFDKNYKQVLLANKETQQWYVWDHAYNTILRSGPGISLSAVNELVSSVKKKFWIALPSLDTIEITVEGSAHLNGTFQKMTAAERDQLFQRWYQTAQTLPSISLDGLYKNPQEQEIYFSYPTFRMRDRSEEISGSYYLSQTGEPVLELNILDEQNSLLSHRAYAIEYQIEEEHTIQSFRLSPAKITLGGVEQIAGEVIVFEKTVSDR